MKNTIDRIVCETGRLRFVWISLGLSLTVLPVSAGEITVSPDRNPVRLNESFTLTFSAKNSPDDDPDFSILEQDFEILNQSQSSNVSIINGDFSKSVNWKLTLMARKAGRLFVPPIPFGRDHSNPLHIEVLDAVSNASDGDSDILLEVSAAPENPYVQAQVVYTVQFLRRVEIAQASLSEPVLENAVIQKLDDDKTYTVWRNGQQYAVTERKYVIFPQESGLVAIPPLEMKADVVTSGQTGFFSRPRTRVRRLQSNAVALDVRPVPAGFKGDYWLPAEQVMLDDHWSNNPPSVKVGEPLTRTLKLTASGVPLSLLPEFGALKFDDSQGNSLKQYPDQPALEEKKTGSGIVSSREQKVALIPSSAGSFRVDGLEIPWWNTRTDRMEVARLPGVTIEAISRVTSESVVPETATVKTDEVLGGTRELSAAGAAGTDTNNGVWFWVSVFLALGWAGTLFVLLVTRYSRKSTEQPEISSETESERSAVKALKKACRQDKPDEAKDALLSWGSCRWPEFSPRNLGGLASRCDENLGAEVRKLNQMLYSRESMAWNGQNCWTAFSNYLKSQPDRKQKKSEAGLEPLFKA